MSTDQVPETVGSRDLIVARASLAVDLRRYRGKCPLPVLVASLGKS